MTILAAILKFKKFEIVSTGFVGLKNVGIDPSFVIVAIIEAEILPRT